MARIDAQFVDSVLKAEDLSWLTLGITPEMMSLDTRDVYKFVRSEVLTPGHSKPQLATIRQFFKGFTPRKAFEVPSFYAKKIRHRYEEIKLRELTSSLVEELEKEKVDLASARKLISETSGELIKIHGPEDISKYGSSIKERQAAYKEILAGRVADFSLGHPVLDEDLIGSERGDFLLIAGTPRAGKSWLLFKTLYNLWQQGLNVMLFSYELSRKIIERRLDAIAAKVRYSRFRRGLLTHEEVRSFNRQLMKNKRLPGAFSVVVRGAADDVGSSDMRGQLDYIYSKIQQEKPDIIGVDGFYLLKRGDRGKESEWEKLMIMSQGFKMISTATNVAAWATSQLTKTSEEKNPQLRDISFSWSLIQDTDAVFLLSATDEMRKAKEGALTVGKFREAEDTERYILQYDPGALVEIKRGGLQQVNPLMEEGGGED